MLNLQHNQVRYSDLTARAFLTGCTPGRLSFNNYTTSNIMAFGKWIGGFLGLQIGGPIGALAGFVLGAIFDRSIETEDNGNNGHDGDGPFNGNRAQQAQYHNSQRRSEYDERDTFRFSLLVLASYIICADGKIMHSEMNLVRQWLRTNFGEAAVNDGEQILLRLFEQQKNMGAAAYGDTVMQCCQQLRTVMTYEQRMQLLHFLSMIAQADGTVTAEEVDALKRCAAGLGLDTDEVDRMLNLHNGGSNLDAAYKVLGISADATDDELKKAYRRLALQNHPDRVASLGEDVRKAAEKKLQEINAAKETIWKARNIR